MSTPDPVRMRLVFDRVERMIEDRWGIPVSVTDVPNPFTGDLDGRQIKVEFDLEVEDSLFILVHLFGHTVQWNVSERSREIAFRKPSESWTEDQLREVAEYESEACAYSLQLLHEAGVHDLDQWVADFAACDTAYLMHFYKTGEKRPFREFWKDGSPILAPKRIPEFQPTQWLSRYDGTVV
ncbi:MAG: hypothetical protein JWP01_2988 [Myxococcales bacterium]|nr:hypothetical protein [Myxococcales bacterium]